MRQGEIWLVEHPNRKARPALVITRSETIAVLNSVVVAPITSTLRSIPTCIEVGAAEGLDHESVATLDQLRSVPKAALVHRIGVLGSGRRHEIREALAAFADC